MVMWKHICLKSSTFNLCKLIKKLPKDKDFIYISLLGSTNKVKRFLFQKTKWVKPQITTKLNPFLKGNPAENHFWLFKLGMQACIISRTAMVKMCSIPCFVFISFLFFSRFFFREHSWSTGQQGKGEAISFSPVYHF